MSYTADPENNSYNEKYFFESSVHTLNTKFYNELLYLMGLSEEKILEIKEEI